MDAKFIFLLVVTGMLWLLTRLIKKRRGWHNFFVIIFSIFITLVVIETAYRFFLKKNAFTLKSNKNFGTYTQHPVAGYMIADTGATITAKIARNGDTIYNTEYTMVPDSGSSSIGLNHRAAYNQRGNDSAQIVFLGCSITFGEGISDSETFAYKTGQLCQTPAVNFGLSGYGTHQAYNIYQNHFNKPSSAKRSFVYSFIPDHILRAKCAYPWNMNDPYFEVAGDSVALKGKASSHSSLARTYKLTRYLSLFNSFTFITDVTTSVVAGKAAQGLEKSDYDRVFNMLKTIQHSAAAHNEKFVVVYWDKYKWKEVDDAKVFDKELIEQNMEALKQAGVTVIKASQAFDVNNQTYFIPGDGHPTPLANQLLAELISRQICK
ncbi:MAG: hypothetical protein H7Y31_12965 [Chitinophagaceae bacterium]|nr:hypothetical protein [Chitinophagaceae bacterium]